MLKQVYAHRFLNSGNKKVLILILLHSFQQVYRFQVQIISLSPYRWFPLRGQCNVIHVTVPRTMLQRYNVCVCVFCHGKHFFLSGQKNRVLYSSQQFSHKYQLFLETDKVLATNVLSVSK